MITDWQTIHLGIRQHSIIETECKYDIGWSEKRGWHLVGVVIEGNEKCQLTILPDGTVKNETGDAIHAPLAEAIWGAASVQFARDYNAIVEQYGLEDTRPYKPSAPTYGVGFRGGKYAA
jgi:hypothetical protein